MELADDDGIINGIERLRTRMAKKKKKKKGQNKKKGGEKKTF